MNKKIDPSYILSIIHAITIYTMQTVVITDMGLKKVMCKQTLKRFPHQNRVRKCKLLLTEKLSTSDGKTHTVFITAEFFFNQMENVRFLISKILTILK